MMFSTLSCCIEPTQKTPSSNHISCKISMRKTWSTTLHHPHAFNHPFKFKKAVFSFHVFQLFSILTRKLLTHTWSQRPSSCSNWTLQSSQTHCPRKPSTMPTTLDLQLKPTIQEIKTLKQHSNRKHTSKIHYFNWPYVRYVHPPGRRTKPPSYWGGCGGAGNPAAWWGVLPSGS